MARKRKEPEAYCGGHPTAAQISDYERNAWPAEQEEALTRHVKGCSVCRNDPRVRRAFVIQLLYIGAALHRGGDLDAAFPNFYAAAEQSLLLPDEQEPADAAALHVSDLRCRAICELANTYRALNELDEAEEALCGAEEHMEVGSGNPLVAARWHDVAGSLFREQRRFDEALQALRWASTLYLENGAKHRAGCCRLKVGSVYLAMGKPRRALKAIESARGLIELTDERFTAGVIHNIVHGLVDAGHHEAAAPFFDRLYPIYEKWATPKLTIQLWFLDAKAAVGLGEHDRAESLFRRALVGFQQSGLDYDAALAGLDLAALLVARGCAVGEVAAVLDGAVTAFVEQEIYRELFMSFELLRGAVQAEQATAGAIARFAEELRAAARRR
jgi:hypothetical protein